MSYVDAGYAICLAVLALYAVLLVVRWRRLERADRRRSIGREPAPGPVSAGSSGP